MPTRGLPAARLRLSRLALAAAAVAVLPGLLSRSLDAQAPGTARVGVLSSTGPTVNPQAARAIQLALPQSLLARADHVIE